MHKQTSPSFSLLTYVQCQHTRIHVSIDTCVQTKITHTFTSVNRLVPSNNCRGSAVHIHLVPVHRTLPHPSLPLSSTFDPRTVHQSIRDLFGRSCVNYAANVSAEIEFPFN